MSISHPHWRLPFFLIALWLVEAALLLLPGHLAITGHEVDVLHAAEAAIRLSLGQTQHIDFLTPLGVLAFSPISLFLSLGFGISTANMAANLLIALCFIPVLSWVALRRMGGKMAFFFAGLTLIMITGVVYGGDQATVSMSMYYNRWGWAAVFVIVVLLLFPDQGDRPAPLRDGVILGAMLGFLLLLKATFFITLAPVVLLVCLIDKAFRPLVAAILTGLIICGVATLAFGGIPFWAAYVSDMLFVSGSEVRPRPGKEIGELLSLPAFLPGSIILLASIMGLRSSGSMRDGLVLFLLAPAFVYITYQNWGNDAKWLLLLGFGALLWARESAGLEVYGYPRQTYFNIVAASALALIAPSFINLSTSPIRNMIASDDDYISVMKDPLHAGLIIERERSFVADAMVRVDGVVDPSKGEEDKEDETLHLSGFKVPRCNLKTGYYGLMRQMGAEYAASDYGDLPFAYVDVANPLPLIADVKRLDYASPWYYGGTRDAAGAEHLLVPKCPISEPTFKVYLDALNASEDRWDLVDTQEFAWVFKRR